MQISVSSFALAAFAGLVGASLSMGAMTTESGATDTVVNGIAAELNEPERDQMRMEQTVIIRVPRAVPTVSKGKPKDFTEGWDEEKMGNCLVMKKVAGVRVSGENALDLLTVDGHHIRAYLGKGCEAREFYSGFYIEKPGDGQFCKNREILHARSGAECKVEKFRLLKPKK